MRLLKKIYLGVAVLLTFLVVALVFVVSTTSGAHLVLHGTARWIPGLEIHSVSGSWQDLTVKNLRYQMPGVAVGIGEFHLMWSFRCLREPQVCLNSLSLSNVHVDVSIAEVGPAAKVLVESCALLAPYPLNLRRLTLNNVRVKVEDTYIVIDELSTGLRFHGNQLTVTPTLIAGLLVSPPIASAKVIAETVALAMKSDIRMLKKKNIIAEARGEFIHPYTRLAEKLRTLFSTPILPPLSSLTFPLNVTLEDIEGKNLRLTGEAGLKISRLRLQAATRDQRAELTLLDIDSPQGLINASGTAQLSGRWPVSMIINATIHSLRLKGEKIALALQGCLRDELFADFHFSGPLTAKLSVKARLSQPGLPLKLALSSPAIQWPLIGVSKYQVRRLSLRVNGEAQDYHLTLKAAMTGEGLPPMDVTLDANSNPEGFMLSSLRLAALQGNTDLSAVVDWQRNISWRSELLLSGINTAHQWPKWPARIDGRLIFCGSLYRGTWQLQVPELELHGHVRQNKLTAKGSLSANTAGQWQVPQFLLALGPNQLTVKGELTDEFALDAVLNAPALPGLGGWAAGNIKLRGNLHAPQLLIDLNAKALRWGRLTLGNIALKGDIFSSNIVRGNLELQLERLVQGSLSMTQLTIGVTGDEKHHQIMLIMKGAPIAGQMKLRGSFDRQRQAWQGALCQTYFDTPLGEWRLMRTMTLEYQASTAHLIIGPHCWKNIHAQICAPKHSEIGTSGKARLLLTRFDLAILKPMLPVKMHASGVFTGTIDVRWKSGSAPPQGKVTLVGRGVKVRRIVQGNKTLPVVFETLRLNAALDKGVVRIKWLMNIAEHGRLKGDMRVIESHNRRLLSGEINVNHLSLSLLQPLVSPGESVDGLLNAALRLGGDVRRPMLRGQLAMDGLVIKGNFMPFFMTESRLAVAFSETRSTLEGALCTTRGQINLIGTASWGRGSDWKARISAKGNQVRIIMPPLARLDISPDIVFEATPTLFSLNGKVDIPWARIKVKDMQQSVVGICKDEVLLDNDFQPITDSDSVLGMPIISNLLVHVGEDVHLDAFGLKARLEGHLKVAQDKQALGLNGQIDIASGRFHAYGQDLIVNKGQLLFSGPVDQPYLNMEAIRNPDCTEDEVTAGVRVSGLADRPTVNVFSEPVKSQQEALSYLLRGHGLDGSGVDSNMMTSMLIGMGVAQSGHVVGKIGKAFRVSDLSLETKGVGESSQVVLSGYMAPYLQVKYGVGIFDSLATLTLRYRLMPKLYLEAVSGLNQTLDMLYRFEF
ncbi:autotransporter assembly complex protein TamB [secondary endosymbiont of Ctenarytaina eucalypti]|uniref:Translocation and assembly module TamB C-terminal domain-containing protein n=1 Tax=secondary endosymbiont of Ctenarytaina eucalypti TaxID=1199245 RepID=J3TFV5_9ENTR|nr:translocation/assembly module TamB domain-containing protein [secondary endosymbiont of Ctenarytaina eucalypti]AFP85202.1 hypothetical protein A359_08360 [secondary endosymbiont of Ctenarytaina eucalypti]